MTKQSATCSICGEPIKDVSAFSRTPLTEFAHIGCVEKAGLLRDMPPNELAQWQTFWQQLMGYSGSVPNSNE